MLFHNLAIPILLCTVLGSFLIGCAQIAEEVSSGLVCRAGSQKLVDWEQKPKLENGYLTMSGTTRNGANIHDPITDPRTKETRINWPAFILNNQEELSDETSRWVAVASIYPSEMTNRLASLNRDGKPRLIAETYDVTPTSFNIRVQVPEFLWDYNLAVSVWGPDVGEEESRAIGAECVNE